MFRTDPLILDNQLGGSFPGKVCFYSSWHSLVACTCLSRDGHHIIFLFHDSTHIGVILTLSSWLYCWNDMGEASLSFLGDTISQKISSSSGSKSLLAFPFMMFADRYCVIDDMLELCWVWIKAVWGCDEFVTWTWEHQMIFLKQRIWNVNNYGKSDHMNACNLP